MIKNVINIWKEEEYTYAAAYGFKPNLRTYLHEDGENRACMLVVPGGGYCMCTPFEGEMVAKRFYEMGMNCFTLCYTTDITMSVPLMKQPMLDLSRAIKYIRKNASEFKIAADKICICGFSAGGHLCATLATHFDEPDGVSSGYQGISDRPDAVILGYPVITTGEYTHIYSVQALVGYESDEELLNYFSAEKNVKENTPPCFIWQTLKDSLVPVENSYLFAKALREKNISFAQYVFPDGDHGLSICDFSMFGNPEAGGEFCTEQLGLALEHVKNGTAVNVSEKRRQELINQFGLDRENVPEDKKEPEKAEGADADGKEEEKRPMFFPPVELLKDVAMWPSLAEIWLEKVLGD